MRQLATGLLIVLGLVSCQMPGPSTSSGSSSSQVKISASGNIAEVVGYSGSLQLAATNESGTIIDPAKVTWSARGLTGIGGVDPNGVVTGAGNGTIEVVAHVDGMKDSLPFQVSVQGTQSVLITGGYYKDGGTLGLFYFVNGTYHELAVPEDSSLETYLTCGDIRNGRVLVAGTAGPTLGQYYYWDNGTRHSLADADSVTRVALDGSSTYILGTSGGKPCYWVDGVRVDLTPPDGYEAPISPGYAPPGLTARTLYLNVVGGVVTVGGIVNKIDYAAGYPAAVCIWTNGVPQVVLDAPVPYVLDSVSLSAGETVALAASTGAGSDKVFDNGVWSTLSVPSTAPDSSRCTGVDVFKMSGQTIVTGSVSAFFSPTNACVWFDNVGYLLENDGFLTATQNSISPGSKLLTVGAKVDSYGNRLAALFWYDGAIVPLSNLASPVGSWYSSVSFDGGVSTVSTASSIQPPRGFKKK